MDKMLKSIELDIELAARLRKLTNKEWRWVQNAIRLAYDGLTELGIPPTTGNIAQLIYESLMAEKQRRMAIR